MFEIVYTLENFRKRVEARCPSFLNNGEFMKLDFPEKLVNEKYRFVRVTGRFIEEGVIVVCEFAPMTYNGILFSAEQRDKTEGEETQRIKKYHDWVKSQIKEKLGIEPMYGRWEP